MIIGIAGTLGAGKGTVVEYLKEKGFVHYSTSGMFKAILESQNQTANREAYTWLGDAFRNLGPAVPIQVQYEIAKHDTASVIIESIHDVPESEFLKKEGNKLLKIIEEPPENTVFLLLAENIEEILITILSRTQVVKFPRLQEKIIAQNLVSRLSVEAEKARKIAQIVEGNWNAAIQLASTNEETSFEEMFEWFHLLLQRNKNLEIIHKRIIHLHKKS